MKRHAAMITVIASMALGIPTSEAQIIQGYAAGGAREEEQKFEDRVRQDWQDPNNPLAQGVREGSFGMGPVKLAGQPIFNPGGRIGPGGPMTTAGRLPGEPVPAGV